MGYRRQVLESIDLNTIQSQGYAFQVEMAYRATQQDFKIVETPIIFIERRAGKSKLPRQIVIEGFIYVLKARFSRQALQAELSKSVSNATQP